MPPKGSKKNAEGQIVGPEDPTHPDNVQTQGLEPPGQTSERLGDHKDKKRNPDGKPAPIQTKLREAPDVSEFYEQEDNTEPYWIGVLPTSPRYNLILGGINFPLETYEVRDGTAPGQTHRIPQMGCKMWLTPEQVKRCVQESAAIVCRIQGNGDKARRPVVDTRTARYRRMRNDHPMGCYAYLIPWSERGDSHPDPIYKMPEHVAPIVERIVHTATAAEGNLSASS